LPQLCLHLPHFISTISGLLPQREGSIVAHKMSGILMSWDGLDMQQSLYSMLIRNKFDILCILLQMTWTIQSVADVIGIVNRDIHPANIAVRVAPYGGRYLYRFVITKPSGSEMTVTIRSKLKLVILDWVNSDACFGVASNRKIDPRILKIFPNRRRTTNSSGAASSSSDPISLRSIVGSNTRVYTDVTDHAIIGEPWRRFCNLSEVHSILHRDGDTFGDSDVSISRCFRDAGSHGVSMWIWLANLAHGHTFGDEYIAVTNFTDEPPRNQSFMAYTTRQYAQWVDAESTTIGLTQDPLVPLSADNSATPATPKKRGRPRKFTNRALTDAERSRKYYAAKKLKKLLLDQHNSNNASLNAWQFSMLTDSTLVQVKPSKIGGLGLFATTSIEEGKTITWYSGLYVPSPRSNKSANDYKQTHLYSIVSGKTPFDIDGLRLPMPGMGVASLVNSSKGGSHSTSNCQFVRHRPKGDVGEVTLSLVATRAIGVNEELLAEYSFLESCQQRLAKSARVLLPEYGEASREESNVTEEEEGETELTFAAVDATVRRKRAKRPSTDSYDEDFIHEAPKRRRCRRVDGTDEE